MKNKVITASNAVLTMLNNALEEMRGNKGLPGAYVQEKLMESLLASPEVIRLRELCLPRQATSDDLFGGWTLDRDNDGTEVVCTIRDARGQEIVTSSPSWMPETPDDALAMPDLYWQLRLMLAAPKLLAACKQALSVMETEQLADDPLAFTQIEWEQDPLTTLKEAIAEAEGEIA